MVFKSKTATKATSPKSDKDQVKSINKKAVCREIKSRFVIYDKSEDGKPLHSGLARTESDAWKLACHAGK